MAVKTITCHIVCCDGCGSDYEHDYTPHWGCPDDAIGELEDAGWKILRDGRVFCQDMQCQGKLPACVCAGDGECEDDCQPGCPCVLHDQVEPDGPCEDCGETFERFNELVWHRYSVHGKTTTMRATLARSAASTSEVTP